MVKYVYKGVRRRYFMDKLLTLMNFSHVYENEKFYKVGFIDGINLIIECIGGKLRC